MGSKYSVGYHGPKGGRGLQDIATLTNDLIAQDNVKPRRIIQGTTSTLNIKYKPKPLGL